MNDRYWLWPASVLTAFSALLAVVVAPDISRAPFGREFIGTYALGTIGFLCIPALRKTFGLMLAGEDRPIAKLIAWSDWPMVRRIVLGMCLATANMLAFCWLKPSLNHHIPFSADPMLAELDTLFFMGQDGWTLLQWMHYEWSWMIYHPMWYTSMIGALVVLFSSAPSQEKSALAITYFVCWSVVGPAIHFILPAGGPLFYEALGYGDRFANLPIKSVTRAGVDYLWESYSTGVFRTAVGISAMPSLHVTMATWVVLVAAVYAKKWLWLVVLVEGTIVLLSVALGWHYLIDGVVGGGCAAMIYLVLRHSFRRVANTRNSNRPVVAME